MKYRGTCLASQGLLENNCYEWSKLCGQWGRNSFFIIIYNFGRFLSFPFFAWVSLSTQTGQNRIPQRMLSSYVPVTVQWIRTLQITNTEKDYKLMQRNIYSLKCYFINFPAPDRHNQFSNFGLFVEKSLKIFKSVSPPVLAVANFEFYREASFPQSVSPIYLVQWARLTEKHIKAISSHLISEFCQLEDFPFYYNMCTAQLFIAAGWVYYIVILPRWSARNTTYNTLR